MSVNMYSLLAIVFLTGMVGDFLLQSLEGVSPNGECWGLKPYFLRHGSIESVCIAGGMMTFFYIIFISCFQSLFEKSEENIYRIIIYLGIYGIILDLLFREFRIFPTLDGYYAYLNYFWSAFWGAIPMILPFLIWFFLRSDSLSKI